MGPVGSGKTSALTIKSLSLMAHQQIGPRGMRMSRGCVVRNTYSDLQNSTMQTWKYWVDPAIFQAPILQGMPHTQHLRFNEIDNETYFLALNDPEDVRKLQGTEFTWFWLSEADKLPVEIFDMCISRLDRYPPKRDGGCTWTGILMDFNAPPIGHWLYDKFEVQKLDRYRLFKQPAALIRDEVGPLVSLEGTHYRLNPDADNIENTGLRYYARQVAGKSDRWISIYLMNEYGFVGEGRAVYDSYNDKRHFADRKLLPYPDTSIPLILGFDFGLDPACVISQVTPRGQLRVLYEVIGTNMGIEKFVLTRLKPFLAMNAPEFSIANDMVCWGDPAGMRRADSKEVTCFQTLREHGFRRALPSPDRSNNFAARKKAVDAYLGRDIDGSPGLLLSSGCPVLRQGFLGNYKEKQTTQGDWELVKNQFSHPHEALQYLCMGLKGATVDETGKAVHAAVARYNRAQDAADKLAGY